MKDNSNSQVDCQSSGGTVNGVIYKIVCTISGKIYVGKTKRNLKTRIAEHKRNISKGKSIIEVAIQKYGWEGNFTVEVLEVCPVENLNEREKFWISALNSKLPNGYNMTDGGDGMVGCTQETRNRMSANHADVSGEKNPMYGKHRSAETKAKIAANLPDMSGENNPMYGKHHSEESKAKMSAKNSGENHPNYGKHHSEETLAKMRGKKRTEETLAKMRARKHTPEELTKMSASMKVAWARKKAVENGGKK